MEQKSLQRYTYIPEAAAKKVLGRNYWSVAKFFLRIFSHCTVLKQSGKRVLCAFMTRRCHVLSLIFLDIFSYYRTLPSTHCPRNLNARELESLTDIDESCFITDLNLVYMGDEIARYYLEMGEFPTIVLADETLIHGRAVNRVLLELEQEVLRRVGEAMPGTNESVRSELLKALELQVFAQKEGPLLLILRFQRCLEFRESCTVEQLREYSRQFALLVSSSNYNNVAYSWSLRLPPESGNHTEHVPHFYETITSLSGIRQNSFFWYYPTPHQAKAVCTIRWRENQISEVEGQRLAVPFILYGDFPASRLLQLHQRIAGDLAELDLHFLRGNDALLRKDSVTGLRWVSETNDLVLCSLLSRRFWGDEMAECQPDWTAVARNYIRFSEVGGNSSICQELKRLWAWANDAPDGLLEEYLCLLLDNSAPIWEFPEVDEPDYRTVVLPETAVKGLTKAVDDAIASISYAAERNAYEKYTANISLSERAVSAWDKCYSIKDILRKSFTLWGGRTGVPEFSYSLGIILQRMDMALIGMHPYTGETRSYTMLQAGEQALFIKPIRYQKYIPTLSMIKRRCGNGQRELRDEIERFVSILPHPEPGLAEELYTFVQDLDYVHQELDDWDIPLSIRLERRTNKADAVTLVTDDSYHEVFREQIAYLMAYTGI